jgi:transposase-like protein
MATTRKYPERSPSSESRYSIMEFMREFPDDEACLTHLWLTRYAAADGVHAECPKCETVRRFKRYQTKQQRQSWTCQSCGHHIQPTAGTIFHKSSTSLQLWFYAIYLITSTRGGISAKQLERELGVTYKTAWRMFNLIRNKLMVQDDEPPLSGDVEADETFWGGKPKASEGLTRQEGAKWRNRKAPIVAAVERKGRIRAEAVHTREAGAALATVKRFVLPEARLITDDWAGYRKAGQHFRQHDTIDHSAKVYVSGDVHTQTIEGFFGNMKRGISGTYHSVSRKWLQGYLNEYTWRYNHRSDGRSMFLTLVGRAAQVTH